MFFVARVPVKGHRFPPVDLFTQRGRHVPYPKAGFGQTEKEPIPSHPRFPDLEREVLAYWHSDRTFAASIAQRPAGVDGANEFVFYDGPPFANGLPH
jgi:isoleucyl-tRNA synthetase